MLCFAGSASPIERNAVGTSSARSGPPFTVLEAIDRWRYLIIAAAAVASTVLQIDRPFYDDWPLFHWASQLLFGTHAAWATEPGGFELYANYHVQIGPLTLLIVAPLRLFGLEGSRLGAIAIMTAMGPFIVWVLERGSTALHGHRSDRPRDHIATLIGSVAAMVAWGTIVNSLHLDDALTLMFGALALLATARGRPAITGVCVGLAIASKLWGVLLLPLTLAFSGRAQLRAIVPAVATASAAWLPFLLWDLRTIDGFNEAQVAGLGESAYSLPVVERSLLGLLGFAGDTPSWARPTQVALGLVLGTVAVRVGRWPAVALIAVSTRVLTDPLVFQYYAAAVVVVALAWEMLRTPHLRSALTVALLPVIYIATEPGGAPDVQALLLLLACTTAIVAGLWLPAWSQRTAREHREQRPSVADIGG
jgi:hypothetical protein